MSSFTWRVRTTWSIVKKWSLRAITFSLLTSVAIRLAVEGMVVVPGRRGVESLVWPLVGGLTAITVAAVAGALLEAPELIAARPGWVQRTMFVALVAAIVAFGAAIGGPALGSTVRLRNDLCLLGLALGSATLLPRTAAWVPAAVVVVVIWFFGPSGGGHPPHAWAILLNDQRDATAWIVTSTTGIMGAFAFLWGRRGNARTKLLGL